MDRGDILVGISGGIDSAASVLLLKEQGYRVTGLYIQMHSPLDNHRELEQSLGITILIHDASELFQREIINKFVGAYMKGETPSPCVECNDKIKWREIYSVATAKGFTRWATGHYCRKVQLNGKYYISRGKDSTKDQSYYLWRLGQTILKGAVFPLGDYTKAEVYQLMGEKGYDSLVERAQSMGVCFLKGENYNNFIKNRVQGIEYLEGGEVINTQGEVIAHHRGYPFYTIAQKRGLDIDNGLCVIDIDVKNNRLIVGNKESLYQKELNLRDCQFVCEQEIKRRDDIVTIVRGIGLNPQGGSQIKIEENRGAKVLLEGEAWAVTLGQPVVFYIDQRVVGGGYISQL